MTMLFVNLPVVDVRAAAAFWSELGFSANPQFCDERTSNVVIDDNIVVMLLERSRFQDFVVGPLADPAAGTSALYCLSADSREAADALAGPGPGGRRIALAARAGPRLHVRPQLRRPRRARLGGHVDGRRRRIAGQRRPAAGRRERLRAGDPFARVVGVADEAVVYAYDHSLVTPLPDR